MEICVANLTLNSRLSERCNFFCRSLLTLNIGLILTSPV